MALSATSSTASTSLAILYPTGLPVINWLDTVVVLYETPWTALANLSVNCFITPDATKYYWQVAGNPIHQSGTYTWSEIGETFVGYIAQFPTNCYLNLYPNRASDGKGVLGGNFTMTSTSGEARTWAASTTIIFPTSTTTPITSSMSTTTSVVPGSSLSTPMTSPTPSPSKPPSPASSLSTGAKAGIGVGAAVGGLLLLSAFIYIIFLHRRLAKTNRPRTTGEISGSPIYEKSGEPGRGFA